jgi:predicted nucleic acid-binding protein
VAVKRFLDTNIILYAASAKDEDDNKRLIALELINEGGFAVGAQVLHEFYNVATRKNKPPMEHDEARLWVTDLMRFPIIPLTAEIVMRGGAISERYQISYWDGAIIAAAEESGAETIFSEDLNSSQQYGSVQVINPFPGYTAQ